MHITELRIRHFRNFVKERFRFREGVNTLIGENGSGKKMLSTRFVSCSKAGNAMPFI